MRLGLIPFLLILTSGSVSAQAPSVPGIYQDLYNTLSTQIAGFNAAVNAGWNGSSYAYLSAPQLETADSDQYTNLLGTYYSDAVNSQLEELRALGANAVTVHIDFPIFDQAFYTYSGNPSQYQQFVTFYQQLAQQVRSQGMKLVVESSLFLPLVGTNVTQFQAYLKTLSWSQYTAGRAANALAVAELIQPDYLTVMTEPDKEALVSGQTNLNTVAGVTELVQQILTTLQQAGVTNIQTGAGAGTWTTNYLQYVQALSALPIDFLDMHIYPLNRSFFTLALTAADTAQAAGKQVGISEFWDMKIRDSELGVLSYGDAFARDPFSFWQPIDIAFLQSIVNFAKYKQLAFISPFWVHYLFAYLDYNTYGLLAPDTILTDSYNAATNANLAGSFTGTGHEWERQNIGRDTTPPATPAAPTTSAIGTTTMNLQWTADSDNVGVSAYRLYRNGALLATTSELVYYDSGLVSGESYTYKLTAADASGNISAISAPLVVETVDVQPPTVPGNLIVTGVTSSSVSLNWTPSTGIDGIGGYWVLRGTSPASLAIHAGVTAPPYTDPYAYPSTTYYYEVKAYNPIGVQSGPSNEVTVTTAP